MNFSRLASILIATEVKQLVPINVSDIFFLLPAETVGPLVIESPL